MTENQNPEIETTEDVEGHAGSRNFIDGPDNESVEGHGRFNVIDGPDTKDVEGHAGRVTGVVAPEPEDVQGHGGKFPLTDDEDVEGHAIGSDNGLGADRGALSGRFRPDEEEMFGREDVTGHGTVRGGLVKDDADEVEGHGAYSNRGASSGRDSLSEPFRPDEEGAVGDDVTGHGTLRGSLVKDDDEGDDTEGHGVRVKI